MKNKIATVILSILLLAAGSGLMTAQSVHAEGSLNVILNGQLLTLESAPAYKNGSTVMIPLRETAEALKYKTTFQGSTGTIRLIRVKDTIEFKLSGQEIILNDKDKISFKGPIEVRQKHVYVPLSFFTAIGLITSYSQAASQAEIYTPEVTASAVTGLLAAGKYSELKDRYLSDAAEQKTSLSLIQQSWEAIMNPAGNYFGIKTTDSHWGEENMTIQSVLTFAKSEAVLTLVIDKSGKIIGLTIVPLDADEALAHPQD